jgi:hypothetical protein
MGAGQTGSLILGVCVGQWHFAQALLPAPPHASNLTNPILGANSYLRLWSPKALI